MSVFLWIVVVIIGFFLCLRIGRGFVAKGHGKIVSYAAGAVAWFLVSVIGLLVIIPSPEKAAEPATTKTQPAQQSKDAASVKYQDGTPKTPEAKQVVDGFAVKTDKPLVNEMLPYIKEVCPGLDKYAPQFTDIHIEENRLTTIAFHIPDNAKIPHSYVAQGHNCFIEIEADGTSIVVPKEACQSVCMDTVHDPLWRGRNDRFYLSDDAVVTVSKRTSASTNKGKIEQASAYIAELDREIDSVLKLKADEINLNLISNKFRTLKVKGEVFRQELPFVELGHCYSMGVAANFWWQANVDASLSPGEESAAVIRRASSSYFDEKKKCQLQIKELANPKKKKAEVILPPTADDKPPRPGCMAIYGPEETTWSCPAK